MTRSKPLLSIILPCLGNSEKVEASLDTLRAQTFQRFETLLAGSNQAVPEQRKSRWAGGNFRIVPATKGLAKGWTTGFAQAAGRYVCFMEPGDELDRCYLEKCLFLLETQPLDLCASWQKSSSGVWTETGPFSFADLLVQDLSAPAAVIRKSCLNCRAPFDLSAPETCQTWDLWLRLARSSVRGYIVPEPLVARQGQRRTTPAEHEWLRQKHAYVLDVLGDTTVTDFGQGQQQSLRDSIWFGTDQRSENPSILLAMPFLTMGGAEASVSRLCQQLKVRGFKVFVITTQPAPAVHGDTTVWFEEHTAGIYHLPRFLDASFWLAFIVHLIQHHSIKLLWLVGSSFVYELLHPIKQLFPDIAVVDLLFNPIGHAARFLKHNYLIDHVVTEYQGMKSWLVEQGEDDACISVIPNAIDVSLYRPEPRLNWRTGSPRRRGEPFVVAFLGRLSEEKAPDSFIEIAARFKDRPEFDFLLGGTGNMEAQLRDLCDRRGLRERVHFLGFISTRDYLPCCDLVVVCSRIDGCPNILMESMAMGVPVLASRVGGIPEMTPDGLGCRLFEPQDIDGFCNAIERLALDESEYERLCGAARHRAETHFSLSHTGERYAGLFTELIRKRAPLSCPVRVDDLVQTTGIKLRDGTKTVVLPLFAWMRFARTFFSPKHAMGNLRTALLYRKLKRTEGSSTDLGRYFDADYYGRKYPEAAALNIPPLWYYLVCGFWKGHRPSLLFDSDYYVAMHKDVASARLNPLIHYLLYGRSEGREARALSSRRNSSAAH